MAALLSKSAGVPAGPSTTRIVDPAPAVLGLPPSQSSIQALLATVVKEVVKGLEAEDAKSLA
jgi:hypothetical protein